MHSSDIVFYLSRWRLSNSMQCTKVRFDSFLSGGFITAIVVNSPEMKQAKRTSVQCNAMKTARQSRPVIICQNIVIMFWLINKSPWSWLGPYNQECLTTQLARLFANLNLDNLDWFTRLRIKTKVIYQIKPWAKHTNGYISSKLSVRNMIKIQLCAVHSKLHDSLNVKDSSTIHFKK